jgi:PIN domain nuclease of toxin-antitoxin system
LLLDTHVWLWQISAPERIGRKTLAALKNPENELYFSIASMWELAIKVSAGKLNLPEVCEDFVPTAMRRHGVQSLPLEPEHAFATATLPLHHRDPFDRILIAQARAENLTLVTADRKFKRYTLDLQWARD